ncbi:sensor domain-containing diguanylate cyclase [Oceanisphaera sp. W20_SRM_FM3]|uniref:sensor domain-containing diguanylate cyclase n=1 Tax=Oceanisphaera sp. W20_SRM_FM3 TaxID=3240267 RepID=UPI003F9C2D30
MNGLIFKRFLLLLCLFSAIVVAITYPLYLQYQQGVKERLLANEETSVVAANQMIQQEMYEQLHVLGLLHNSARLKDYVTGNTEEQRQQLALYFQQVSSAFHRFDQIRLLDNDGQELVRVELKNGHGEIVSQSQLQNKSDRYYFTEAKDLAPDEVFVSRLDLNMERGEIELPHKPMLRFSVPVFDNNEERAGVLVLNYLAKNMLGNFRSQMLRRANQQGMLLDDQGYWLSNHERSNEWGADLGKPDHTFAIMYPEEWPTIASTDSGILETKAGIFRFQTVQPFGFATNMPTHFMAQHDVVVTPQSVANTHWKLVIFVPYDFIQKRSFLYQTMGKSLLSLLVLFLVGAALLTAIVTTQRDARRREAQRLNEVLHDLYDNAPCGYHSLDDQGLVIRINQTELDWLGYQRAEVINQPFSHLLTPASQAEFQAFFSRFTQGIRGDNPVLEMQRKDGSTFYISNSATVLKDKQGHFAAARTSVFDISERIELEQKLELLANRDELTGISNRRHFYERGELELKRGLRYQQPLAVLMLDADHFKTVNDNYGHDVGDLVLKSLANTVSHNLRETDVFGRIGGEEFAIVLTQTAQAVALDVAERLRHELEQIRVPVQTPALSSDASEQAKSEPMRITVSIGLVMLSNSDQQLDDLLKKADIALYQAKAQGRNRVVQYQAVVS